MGEIIKEFKSQAAQPSAVSQTAPKAPKGFHLTSFLEAVYLNQFRVILSCCKEAIMQKIEACLYSPDCSFTLTQISQPYKLVDTPLSR